MHNLFGANAMLSSPSAYMLLAAALMIPTVWLPDLRALSALGFVGVTATCTVVSTVSR
jgi:vesicular inhibitory amino acid transporter